MKKKTTNNNASILKDARMNGALETGFSQIFFSSFVRQLNRTDAIAFFFWHFFFRLAHNSYDVDFGNDRFR